MRLALTICICSRRSNIFCATKLQLPVWLQIDQQKNSNKLAKIWCGVSMNKFLLFGLVFPLEKLLFNRSPAAQYAAAHKLGFPSKNLRHLGQIFSCKSVQSCRKKNPPRHLPAAIFHLLELTSLKIPNRPRLLILFITSHRTSSYETINWKFISELYFLRAAVAEMQNHSLFQIAKMCPSQWNVFLTNSARLGAATINFNRCTEGGASLARFFSLNVVNCNLLCLWTRYRPAT